MIYPIVPEELACSARVYPRIKYIKSCKLMLVSGKVGSRAKELGLGAHILSYVGSRWWIGLIVWLYTATAIQYRILCSVRNTYVYLVEAIY